MKNLNFKRTVVASTLALALSGLPVLAQGPVIASFGRNGELVCTNLLTATPASVEWASSVLGPWTNTWEALSVVMADSNGVVRVSVPMFYRVRGFAAPSNMAHIPASTFIVDDDGGPPTVVTIGREFWMGKYEVTQGEYLAVMGSNPSWFTGDLNRPVEQVSWNDATNYCAHLTALEWAAGRLPAGWAYRLPTEAQWEYACRAGTTTPFHYGKELRSGMANFCGNYEYLVDDNYHYNPDGIYLGRTTAVGSYVPNAWGLYDMHGNVWEWCQDWDDPSSRVFRGGDWADNAFYCRSASRDGDYGPEVSNYNLGFRVVLAPDQP